MLKEIKIRLANKIFYATCKQGFTQSSITSIISEEKPEQLIFEIQKNPILFDKTRQDYKNTNKKKDIKLLAVRL